MAAAREKYIKLAQSLPPQLLRFFQRNQEHLADYFANAAKKVTPTAAAGTFAESSKYPNPFRSQKNLETGRWHDPIYSLRRQADLVKLARANGVEELLPPTVKGTEARIQKRAANGLRVKGTGYGQRVKGKLWERTMKGRLERRRQAMEAMPTLIEEWKKVKISKSLMGFDCANYRDRRAMVVGGGSGRSRTLCIRFWDWDPVVYKTKSFHLSRRMLSV